LPLEQPPTVGATSPYRDGSHWWKQTPWWAKYVVLPMAVGFTGMATLLLGLRAEPLPDQSFLDPTRVEAADGTVLTEWTLKGTRTEPVPFEQIPLALRQATIAVEDAQFYHHRAFNTKSIARALLVDVWHGHVVQGGSTITQQLAKNLFLDQHRTIHRKLREAMFSIQLELQEPKSTILTQYLNSIYYGHGAYGVRAAAQLYFHKPVHNLSLAESALLAGLPKGPSLYSPLLHPDAAKARQQTVLNRMVKTGYISQTQANLALAAPLNYYGWFQPNAVAPYFTSTSVHEATTRFQLSPDALYRGGIRLTTTLDPVLQTAAERALATTLPKGSDIQAALVAIDPETGAIKAMVGGRNFATSPYNRVFAQRQPGSTFKAILYTSALQHGWTPSAQVASELTTFIYDKSKLYTVHDFGNLFAHRPLTMRDAIARSDNVYAVTTNMDVGPEVVIQQARKMGITTPLKPYPALALGVFPTSPLQMATAYAALANGGLRVQPYTVDQVRSTVSGDSQQQTTAKTRVVDAVTAFQMTDLLASVVQPGGTGYRVHGYLHGPVAAKTGTTDTDAWMAGYTPRLVCAVWVGYDDNKLLTTAESHLAAPIWAKFMGTAQQRLPSQWFSPPVGLEKHVVDGVTGQLATDTCRDTETDYFLPGTAPTADCALHPATPAAGDSAAAAGPQSWWHQWFRRIQPKTHG